MVYSHCFLKVVLISHCTLILWELNIVSHEVVGYDYNNDYDISTADIFAYIHSSSGDMTSGYKILLCDWWVFCKCDWWIAQLTVVDEIFFARVGWVGRKCSWSLLLFFFTMQFPCRWRWFSFFPAWVPFIKTGLCFIVSISEHVRTKKQIVP